MDWGRLKQQLAWEVEEYLADLRVIRDDLKNAEGWIGIVLFLVALLMTIAWVILSLGFSPGNDHVINLLNRLGLHSCRPINNFSGIVIFVDFILLIFLTVISMGNSINMLRRVRRKQPREPRDLLVSTALMLIVGIGGIVFMIRVC